MTEASQQVSYEDLDRAAEEAMSEANQAVVEEETEEIEEEATAEGTEDDSIRQDTDNDSDEGEDESEETFEEETGEAEEVTAKPAKAKDEENAERSKLGRKVKSLEDTVTRLERLLELQEKTQAVKTEEDDDDEDVFITKKDLPKYVESLEAKKEQTKLQYQQEYTREFAKIGGEDDRFDEIWEEMLERHNTINTGSPVADAQINFYKAKAALAESRKPVNPVKGKAKQLKTKTNIPAQMKGKEPTPVKLDPVAAEYVRKMGIKQEFVQKTLSK